MPWIEEQEEHVPLYEDDVPGFVGQIQEQERKPRMKEEQKPFTLSPEGVLRRLEAINQKPILIENLSPEYVSRTTSRVHFLSRRYGGSQQDPTPRPAKRFINAHGIPQFCFLMPTWSPHAPRRPGEPGLAFLRVPECFRDPELNVTAIPTWVRKSSDRWQYIGHYRFVPSEPLSVAEWLNQDLVVRETRIANIFGKDWQTRRDHPGARLIRYKLARHIVQRELKLAGHTRRATEEEIQQCLDDRRYNELTADIVREDFANGLLTVSVCALECYGYDERFQRELVEGFSQPRHTWPRVFDDAKIEPLDDDIEIIERKPFARRKRMRRTAAVDRPAKRRRMMLDCVEIVVPTWLASRQAREISPEL